MLKNKKKCLVFGKETLYFDAIKNILEKYNYRVNRLEIDSEVDDSTILSRLIVVVFREIDDNVIKICKMAKFPKNRSVKIPVIAILEDVLSTDTMFLKHLNCMGAITIEDSCEVLEDCIEYIENDKNYISEKIKRRSDNKIFSEFTRRQYEIFQLTLQGFSIKEVAKTLNIAEKTVRNHSTNINKLLGTNSRYESIMKVLKREK